VSPLDVTDITGPILKGKNFREGNRELKGHDAFKLHIGLDDKCRTLYLQELFFLKSANSRVTVSREAPIIWAISSCVREVFATTRER
jgi:hypothetical protein